MPHDPVDHPNHYTSHPSGVECITVTEHMNFNRGNAVKYIWRAGDKGNIIEDLRKARWYIDREIQRLETEQAHDPIIVDAGVHIINHHGAKRCAACMAKLGDVHSSSCSYIKNLSNNR